MTPTQEQRLYDLLDYITQYGENSLTEREKIEYNLLSIMFEMNLNEQEMGQ